MYDTTVHHKFGVAMEQLFYLVRFKFHSIMNSTKIPFLKVSLYVTPITFNVYSTEKLHMVQFYVICKLVSLARSAITNMLEI